MDRTRLFPSEFEVVSMPRVAVLLSTYNGEEFLAAQLDSLAAQKSVTVEVFVRDDGSTDNTASVLRAYAHLWPALADLRPDANLGPAASFLELLRRVPDDFDCYAFCDQDDVWMPEKLYRATQRLAEVGVGKPALYCSSVVCVDRDLNPIGETPLMGSGRFDQIIFANIACGNTMVMNAAAATLIRANVPGRAMIMHDWWCALVISAFGAVLCDQQPSILYRQHQLNAYGASPGRLPGLILQLKKFLRDPRGFYPIHAQVVEFLRLYGERIAPRERRIAEALVASRRSLASRISYAAFGRIARWDLWGAVGTRVLILAGWY
jgi:glycosyltransferase involved in cell wall biosynthesis